MGSCNMKPTIVMLTTIKANEEHNTKKPSSTNN